MTTPNPKGYPTALWSDDVEIPHPRQHWSFNWIADYCQKIENRRERANAKEQRRKDVLATL